MLDIRATTAQKPKKKQYISMATTIGFIHKEVRGGINHAHTIKEINESLQKKLAATDKSMETIHAKMDGFSMAMKN